MVELPKKPSEFLLKEIKLKLISILGITIIIDYS